MVKRKKNKKAKKKKAERKVGKLANVFSAL